MCRGLGLVVITGGIVVGDEVLPNANHPLRRLSDDERNVALGETIIALVTRTKMTTE